ncbi:MAG: hypothetical protein KIT36_24920, partial [Alphaproteobacteria bacterium]|nr:hypothetical protein [Alphaproteobacteria bacterium]
VRLSIQCRAGRTELVVAGPPAPRGPEDYIVSYRINDGPEVPVAAGPPAAGVGAALRVDVARLLTSLPEAGELAVRVVTRQGATHEGAFSLAGIKTVRVRIAAPCKWPAAGESPRN